MNPADLRHRVTFQKKTETRDSLNAVVEAWTEDFTCWGAFEPMGSREFPVAHKRFAETTARFRIRYVLGRVIDPDQHRIVMTFDPIAGVQSIFDIYPPLPVAGKYWELHIEAVQRT